MDRFRTVAQEFREVEDKLLNERQQAGQDAADAARLTRSAAAC
jgi:hypothetical protein